VIFQHKKTFAENVSMKCGLQGCGHSSGGSFGRFLVEREIWLMRVIHALRAFPERPLVLSSAAVLLPELRRS
jgi:hypothetical protein